MAVEYQSAGKEPPAIDCSAVMRVARADIGKENYPNCQWNYKKEELRVFFAQLAWFDAVCNLLVVSIEGIDRDVSVHRGAQNLWSPSIF